MVLFSQVNETIVNATSLSLKNNTYIFDVAIGETIVTTLNSPFGILTQGFLQPVIKPTNTIGSLYNENNITVFPNPFKDKINIKSNFKNTQNKLFDLTGRLIYSCKETVMSLAFLSNGFYTLIVYNENEIPLSTFKICKIE